MIFGDDIGTTNISAYSDGLMGYETPHIDRIAREGLRFLHYYGEQSCTAGRSVFLTGQYIIRTGLSKVGSGVSDSEAVAWNRSKSAATRSLRSPQLIRKTATSSLPARSKR
jgi:arylsulfatase A-like enzyme